MKYFLFKRWSYWEGTLKVCLCSSEVNFNIWLENTKWPKCHHRTWCYTNGDTLQDRKTHTQSALHRKQIDWLFVMLTLTELLSRSSHSLLCAFMKSDQIPETWFRSFTDSSLNFFPVWVRSESWYLRQSHLPPGLPNRNLQVKTGMHFVVKNFSVQ